MANVPRWLPNAITVLRIALVPVWAGAAEAANRAAEAGASPAAPRAWAAAILVAIGVSDVVDGFVARRYGLASPTGEMLDAVADKLAQVVLVTYLALRDGPAFAAVPMWFLGLLVVRDLVLLAGVLVLRARRRALGLAHRWHGKAASVLLFLLLLAFNVGHGQEVTVPLLVAIAVLVVWSAGLYVRVGWRLLRAGRAAR